MDEANRLLPGVPTTGARTQYQLWRLTAYGSLTYQDLFTGYVEGIDASAFGYDAPLTPVGIDVNRADLLRYYAEINIGDLGAGNLSYRYGRQFLKYGSQHVLSNLGWGNTYRNFEGHKLLYQGEDWSIDAFAMNSVNAAAGGSKFDSEAYDTPDHDRQVNGIYSTYSGLKNNTLDFYWIWSLEENPNPMRHDGDRHTLGVRWAGKKPVEDLCEVVGTWAWDIEGAYQFGEDNFGGVNQDVQAGFFSALAGYTFNALPGSPTFNGIFFWGSGDDDPTDGEINTVYTLYPLGHAYWGLIDNFSGQNLLDSALQASIKPHNKVSCSGTFHWFHRATENDSVYNIVGAGFATGTPGRHIGNELDLVTTFTINSSMNVQLGYFWFWYGDAIENGAPRPDASQFYCQTVLDF
ncbi:MAG: alginate export family protein [Planctomycetaceae bacterium]|nr:alginate export family protein [Planctomycetaceae bacterium]